MYKITSIGVRGTNDVIAFINLFVDAELFVKTLKNMYGFRLDFKIELVTNEDIIKFFKYEIE